jgi:hypothetical protein
MEKLLLMLAAAELTSASVGGHANDELASVTSPDPNIQSPVLKARNLEVWEVFRIYYAGIQQALADDTDWPPPPANASSGQLAQNVLGTVLNPTTLASLVPTLAALVPQAAPVVTAIQALLGSSTKPGTPAKSAAPSGNIPNPGAKPVAVPADTSKGTGS